MADDKIIIKECDITKCVSYRMIQDIKERVERLETNKEGVNTTVALIAQKLDTFMKAQESNMIKLSMKIDELTNKPAKRWESLITAIIALLVGYAFSKITM